MFILLLRFSRVLKPLTAQLWSKQYSFRSPASSAAHFPVKRALLDGELRAIQGTVVNLGETMKLFREFLKGFQLKYIS